MKFWTEIHLQAGQHAFDRNVTRKNAIILYNFGSGSIFTFFDGRTLKFSQV